MNGTTPTDANIAPPVPDWVLVARVLDGERGAFEWIMRRYNQRMYRLVRSILHHEQDVLDTMQDAYIKGFRRLDQFKGPNGLGAWFCTIARNEALARLRFVQKASHAGGERGGVAGAGENGVVIVGQKLMEDRNIGGDDRQARAGGFEDDETEAFVDRWEGEPVGCGHPLRHLLLRYGAQQDEVLIELEPQRRE